MTDMDFQQYVLSARSEALQLALQTRIEHEPAQITVERAQAYFEWVIKVVKVTDHGPALTTER